MNKDEDFSYDTPDIHGLLPNWMLIGYSCRHTGNNKRYRITGYAWGGENDEWNFIAVPPSGSPQICRPLKHLNGNREDGSLRYVAWQNSSEQPVLSADMIWWRLA